MNQAGGRKQTELSDLQKALLLWIAKVEGRGAVVTPLSTAKGAGVVELNGVSVTLTDPPDYTRAELTVKKIGSRWSPERFLGRPPTANESSVISRSLARLERQGLIKRTASRGKRARTSHVRLTAEGLSRSIRELSETKDLEGGQ